MVVLNFLWYCIKCMLTCFAAMCGKARGITLKEILVGNATLFVLILIGLLILWLNRAPYKHFIKKIKKDYALKNPEENNLLNNTKIKNLNIKTLKELLSKNSIYSSLSIDSNHVLSIKFHDNFILKITQDEKWGPFDIHINSFIYCSIETSDIYYFLTAIDAFTIVQYNKPGFFRDQIKFITASPRKLEKLKKKKNVLVFNCFETLIDN